MAEFANNGVGDGGKNPFGPLGFQDFGGGAKGAGGFGHIVNEDDIAALDLANDLHGLDLGGGNTVFGHDGETSAEGIRVGARHFHAPDIRRDYGEIFTLVAKALAQGPDNDGLAIEVVHRDVEKPLNLSGMEIHRDHPVDTGRGEQIRNQLGGDGHAGLVLAVLPGVSEEWNDGIDPSGAGPLCGIDHNHQLHEVMIGRGAGGLDDVNVLPADILVDLDEGFAIRKGGHADVGEGALQASRDIAGEGVVGGARKKFHAEIANHLGEA